MTKQELAKYPSYKKRSEKLKEDIYELETIDIECVYGKVKGSMRVHPYIERRFSAQIKDPEEAKKIHKQIVGKQQELEEIKRKMQAIEEFINEIQDVHIKTIFEYRYLEGMSCEKVGKKMGYTKVRISQKIKDYFSKDLTKLNEKV